MLTVLAWLIVVAFSMPIWVLVSWVFMSVAIGDNASKREVFLFMLILTGITLVALAGFWAINYLWGSP